jgi:predicted nucleotidyltransferase
MQTKPNQAITLAILHGSRATGNASQRSDWDVALLGGTMLGRDDRSRLRRGFAAKLGVPEEKVDVSDLRSDSPLLRYRVAMYGKLIEGSASDFREFQIRAWKDYLNNRKIFELQEAFLHKALS